MKISKPIIAIATCFFLAGCSSVKTNPSTYMEGATLWHHSSAEFAALSYQAYNLAKMRLREALRTKKNRKKAAVVLDVDQTILDGSPYQAVLIREKISYPTKWREYVEIANGEAIPGALDFLNYANKRGVQIFYVTNRKERGKEGTMRNLKALGFPQVTVAHTLCRTDTASKQPRRDAISKKHDILVLVGDNLNDFDVVFEKDTVTDRKLAVEKTKKRFGSRFIILPNAMYGAWEGAVYEGNWGLSTQQRAEKRLSVLPSVDIPVSGE